jgi:hypothetical protein
MQCINIKNVVWSSLNHAVTARARLINLQVQWHFGAHYKHFMLPEKKLGEHIVAVMSVRLSVRSSILAQIS